ncbi:MAG: transcriptional regulator [Bacteroidota bacterium]|nr:transcriptional regulator [Bacteroidota bacterium]
MECVINRVLIRIIFNKLEALIYQPGDDWNLQKVSALEQKETLDAPTLDKVANALGISADAIKNFNEEATFNIISNNYHDHSSSVNYQFNPIEKIAELYQQKIELYERMLKEKNELIDKLMNSKKE